jgi:hypothetical protein
VIPLKHGPNFVTSKYFQLPKGEEKKEEKEHDSNKRGDLSERNGEEVKRTLIGGQDKNAHDGEKHDLQPDHDKRVGSPAP